MIFSFVFSPIFENWTFSKNIIFDKKCSFGHMKKKDIHWGNVKKGFKS